MTFQQQQQQLLNLFCLYSVVLMLSYSCVCVCVFALPLNTFFFVQLVIFGESSVKNSCCCRCSILLNPFLPEPFLNGSLNLFDCEFRIWNKKNWDETIEVFQSLNRTYLGVFFRYFELQFLFFSFPTNNFFQKSHRCLSGCYRVSLIAFSKYHLWRVCVFRFHFLISGLNLLWPDVLFKFFKNVNILLIFVRIWYNVDI